MREYIIWDIENLKDEQWKWDSSSIYIYIILGNANWNIWHCNISSSNISSYCIKNVKYIVITETLGGVIVIYVQKKL